MTIGICGLMMSCSFWPICSHPPILVIDGGIPFARLQLPTVCSSVSGL
jgi:hypothetical protein